MSKKKQASLSKIKFDKNKVVSPAKIKKIKKRLDKQLKEIDEKRKVDWEKLNKTYITI